MKEIEMYTLEKSGIYPQGDSFLGGSNKIA